MHLTKKHDKAVTEALYQLCVGRRVTEITRETKPDKNGDLVETVKEKTTFTEPNMTAVSFWLCNRRPDLWSKSVRAVTPDEPAAGGVVLIPAVEETDAGMTNSVAQNGA